MPNLENYIKVERRRLRQMLDYLLGKENRKTVFVEDFKFNVFDYQFFDFLLDTYNTKDSRRFRSIIKALSPKAKRESKYKISDLDSNFIYIIKCGVKNFVLLHPNVYKELLLDIDKLNQ